MTYFVNLDGTEYQLILKRQAAGRCLVQAAESEAGVSVEVLWADGSRAAVKVGHRIFELAWSGRESASVQWLGRAYRAKASRRSPQQSGQSAEPSAEAGPWVVRAPMPGKVVKVCVELGAAVPAQSPLLVIEAMKMENELLAPRVGTVQEILVAPGATVERGAALLRLA